MKKILSALQMMHLWIAWSDRWMCSLVVLLKFSVFGASLHYCAAVSSQLDEEMLAVNNVGGGLKLWWHHSPYCTRKWWYWNACFVFRSLPLLYLSGFSFFFLTVYLFSLPAYISLSSSFSHTCRHILNNSFSAKHCPLVQVLGGCVHTCGCVHWVDVFSVSIGNPHQKWT